MVQRRIRNLNSMLGQPGGNSLGELCPVQELVVFVDRLNRIFFHLFGDILQEATPCWRRSQGRNKVRHHR